MPKIDKSTITPSMVTLPMTKVRKKESTNAETNTDPWKPQCETCIQRKTSQFLFENNTIDMNEYISALNYINSIHGLINESQLLKSNLGLNKNSNISLKANICMPNLPNFLSIFSSISNLNINANTSSHMISRTTSTSTLPSFYTVIENSDKQTQDESNGVNYNEHKAEDSEEDSDEIVVDLLTVKGRNRQIDPVSQSQSMDKELPEPDLYPQLESMSYAESTKTDTICIMQGHEMICKQCSNSLLKCNKIEKEFTKNAQNEILQQRGKHRQLKQAQQNKILEQQHSGEELRKKIRSKSTIEHEVTIKNKFSPSNTSDVTTASDDSKENHTGPMLSDAELDRFASELLIGVEWDSCDASLKPPGNATFTAIVPIAKQIPVDKLKTTKIRPPQIPNPDPAKKKLLQKVKEVTPQTKEKSFTGIPVKQNSRHNSIATKRCNSDNYSPPRNKNSTGRISPPMSPPVTRPRTPPPVSSRRNLRIDSSNLIHISEECISLKEEKIDNIQPILTAKPKVLNFQMPSLTSIDKNKASPRHQVNSNRQSSISSLPLQKQTLQLQKKSKVHVRDGSPKKGTATYKIQQKDDDDFVCPRKNFKTRLPRSRKSSDSTIISDKEDRAIANLTDSDIHDDISEKRTKAFTFQSKGSRSTLQKPLKKAAENIQQDVKSNERFVVSIPSKKKKDTRNKPFRQTRKHSGDNEEIVHIRHYVSPCKHDSDSKSSSTGSSDIKSDVAGSLKHI